MTKNSKTYLIIGSVVIVLLIAAFFLGRLFRKQSGASKLPEDQDWGGSLSSSDSEKVNRLTIALYEDMRGVNFWKARNPDPYEELSRESDKILVAVSNQFFEKYNQSMIEWMKAEQYHWYSFDLQTVVNTLISRLAKYAK